MGPKIVIAMRTIEYTMADQWGMNNTLRTMGLAKAIKAINPVGILWPCIRRTGNNLTLYSDNLEIGFYRPQHILDTPEGARDRAWAGPAGSLVVNAEPVTFQTEY